MHYPALDTKSARIIYVGLDVDDQAFHGCVVAADEVTEFKTKSSAADLIETLEKFKKADHKIKVCYEAGYLGYSLQRELSDKGYDCDVVAPSLIPRAPGKKVKTDRLDAKKLALYYQKGLLTAVHIPSKEQEAIRDLLRSRSFVQKQIQRIRHHILSSVRRMGLHYRQETNNPRGAYWTKTHLSWLLGKIEKWEPCPSKLNFSLLLSRLDVLEKEVNVYDTQVKALAEESVYLPKIRALTCYRGIDTLAAMSLVTEIGNIRRFSHPRKLTSYCGMDIVEYSSGGKERKFHMSKMGNKHIRTCVIEACQFVSYPPIISKSLKDRRQNTPPNLIQIADRCMKRLYKKSRHLIYREKPINKIKAACAREMLGFIWESLRAAA